MSDQEREAPQTGGPTTTGTSSPTEPEPDITVNPDAPDAQPANDPETPEPSPEEEPTGA